MADYYKCTMCGKVFNSKPTVKCEQCGSNVFVVIKQSVERVKLLYPGSKFGIVLWNTENFIGRNKIKGVFNIIDDLLLTNIEEPHFKILIDKNSNNVFIEPVAGELLLNGKVVEKKEKVKRGDKITIGLIEMEVSFDISEEETNTIKI